MLRTGVNQRGVNRPNDRYNDVILTREDNGKLLLFGNIGVDQTASYSEDSVDVDEGIVWAKGL